MEKRKEGKKNRSRGKIEMKKKIANVKERRGGKNLKELNK